MKRISFVFLLASISLLVLLLGNCKKDEPKIIKQKVTGHVQKGPYINGTSISMYELNSSLEQTGKIFTTEISNNIGSFEISNVSLTSSYVEFSASGYYFDEVKGDISIAPLNLFALSDITDISTVNVNILTHLEKLRVEYLVTQNKTLSEAKNIAQGEILAIFDFSLTGIDKSETLDISVNNDGNAILLAISIILQGNRSVGDLTELLANITNDIREDGILNSESIMTNLRNSTKELSLTTIRSNLQNRYQALGINASIPAFEKYINDFLVFTGQKPESSTQPATKITATSVLLNGMVNANSLSTIVTFEYGASTSYGNTIPATQSPVTGSSDANVSAGLTGLLSGTTYHFRVKTENALGTTYGNEVSFTTQSGVAILSTTSITSILAFSAATGGNITDDGGSAITSRGVCFGTSQNPTTANSFTSNGTGIGWFTSNITGLALGTTYYVRAYATNSVSTTYGNELSFTTIALPTITTSNFSDVQGNSAIAGGSIINNGGSTITAQGLSWSTSHNPTISDNFTASFTATITSLSPSTVYYVRAYATNIAGTGYGNEISFNSGYVIGTTYGGGLVFYNDGSAHGLVCAPTDQSTGVAWGCYGTLITGADGTAIGTGNQNTIDILTGCTTVGIAAKICYDLVLNTYSDWFLPSIDELTLMNVNLHGQSLGGFAGWNYWSSTEANSNCAWLRSFSGSQNFYFDKNVSLTYYVRAVRAY
ncbi:MAG: hypothetical protein NT144_00495 [Bacteroidia bacterium]|nr:hypothetical protein [Bacteroidia bacterium]